MPLIAKVCDYAYCLESGVLIAEGAPDEVTAQPQVIESFLGRGGAAGRSKRRRSTPAAKQTQKKTRAKASA